MCHHTNSEFIGHRLQAHVRIHLNYGLIIMIAVIFTLPACFALPARASTKHLSPIHINERIIKKLVATNSVGDCGNFKQHARTFLIGTIRRSLTAFPYWPTDQLEHLHHNRFTKGEKVLIAGQIGNMVCVSAITRYSKDGYVPRNAIKVLATKGSPKPVDWAGIWASENGDWFELSSGIKNNFYRIVYGVACTEWCYNQGKIGGALGTLWGFPVKNDKGGVLKWTRFFSVPDVHQPAINDGSRLPTISDPCRFYATLLPDDNEIVVSGTKECSMESWNSLYYKVSSFPPYHLIEAYFRNHKLPYDSFAKQWKKYCSFSFAHCIP